MKGIHLGEKDFLRLFNQPLDLEGLDSERDIEGTPSYQAGGEKYYPYDPNYDHGCAAQRAESYPHHHYPHDKPDSSVKCSHVALHI
jgi:hypothetical protein